MILKRALTPAEKSVSRKNYLIYNIINGASYMCLGETVLILLAVQLQCSDTVVAILGCMMYLGFLLLPLGKWMTARTGAAKSQAQFWVYRNIAVLTVSCAVPVSLWFSRDWAELPLLLGAFLFYGFRAAGIVMSQPLVGEICETNDRGRFIAISGALFYLTGFTALGVITLLLKWSSNIWTLFWIIVSGASLGIISSRFLLNIHETDRIQLSAREPLRGKIAPALRLRVIRRQIVAGMICYLAYILVVPISMLTLKRGYEISDTLALIFALFQFAGMTAAGYVQSRIADKLGSRNMVLIAYACFGLTAVLWIISPSELNFLFTLPAFLAGAYGGIGTTNALPQYYLDTVPPKMQIVSSIIISLSTGVIAGLLGMVISSGLLKLSASWNHSDSPFLTYRIYFILVAILILLMGIFVRRLENCRA